MFQPPGRAATLEVNTEVRISILEVTKVMEVKAEVPREVLRTRAGLKPRTILLLRRLMLGRVLLRGV